MAGKKVTLGVLAKANLKGDGFLQNPTEEYIAEKYFKRGYRKAQRDQRAAKNKTAERRPPEAFYRTLVGGLAGPSLPNKRAAKKGRVEEV